MYFESEHERDNIQRVSGGMLPFYSKKGNSIVAACDCSVGTYMMKRYHLMRYDSIPGTLKTDTKHDLVVGHFTRLCQEREKKTDGGQSSDNASTG